MYTQRPALGEGGLHSLSASGFIPRLSVIYEYHSPVMSMSVNEFNIAINTQ